MLMNGKYSRDKHSKSRDRDHMQTRRTRHLDHMCAHAYDTCKAHIDAMQEIYIKAFIVHFE